MMRQVALVLKSGTMICIYDESGMCITNCETHLCKRVGIVLDISLEAKPNNKRCVTPVHMDSMS